MTDAAFREALDAFRQSIHDHAGGWHNWQPDHAAVVAARARVLALYAERQGEVYEVKTGHPASMVNNFIAVGFDFAPGDRVRVTKVEEGQ